MNCDGIHAIRKLFENQIGYGWKAGAKLISKLSEYSELFILIQLHKS